MIYTPSNAAIGRLLKDMAFEFVISRIVPALLSSATVLVWLVIVGGVVAGIVCS